MSGLPRDDITRLLQELDAGTSGAVDQLLPVVYAELRRVADGHLRRERAGHTLSPTALVHEAYLRLVGSDPIAWESRAHFFGIAARAMRQILVAHARRRGAEKRGGQWERVTLYTDETPSGSPGAPHDLDLIAVHDALERLSSIDERTARVVELRFFAGLTLDETAHVIGVSRRTVADDWSLARAWLARELGVGGEG